MSSRIKTIKSLAEFQNGIYLVAERDGKIVGHAFLEPLHLQSICHVAQLSIGVHHGWQEKGIGTDLMKELIAWAKQSATIEKIELNVRASNYREMAIKRLPKQLVDFLDGGAFDEITIRKNSEDFQKIQLKRSVLKNVANIDISTEILG
ncbi:MAG TPA: GNAT family N-acetyltransferase, partial [Chlamydiales bacterium]|nr:GNAT family N-acetyltransferase [Chlamydiales bacterium]